ncbi:uncharacterized protein LOC125476736 [Pyrus x bretschneideri]|uniref:uncharacterized protein LOC125476736 n=1 Tax=Pyrus x bretschneideri TaxID=225117 RepID=UPI00202FE11B|nr:uncharacterized protein LOC125476736 [Pyrus x bretschneideri]
MPFPVSDFSAYVMNAETFPLPLIGPGILCATIMVRKRGFYPAFTQLSWWLWSGKQKEPRIPKGSSSNSSPDSGMRETDALKFPSVKGSNMASSSSRSVKRKWHSREERKIDREYDVVLVPSEGGCVSGSESEASDWSVGWLEPVGPGFQRDDDADDSFAVLVPCYGHVIHDMVKDSKNNILSTVGNIPDESTKYMEEWLSSLRNS